MNIGKNFVIKSLYMKGRNPEVFVTLKTWLLVIIVILLLLCHISSDSLAPSYPVFQTAIETHSRINTSKPTCAITTQVPQLNSKS